MNTSPRSRKTIPMAMLIFSLAYFPYIISQGNSRMIGDELGGDPGGVVLPAFLAGFMLLGSIFLLFFEKTPSPAKTVPRAGAKFYITLGLGVFYLVSFKTLGFMITSTILIFSLSFIASLDSSIRKSIGPLLAGLVCTLSYTIAIYSLCRLITRNLLTIGRTTSFTIASAPFFIFSVDLAALGLVLLLSMMIVRKMKSGALIKTTITTGIVTAGSVEFLFLVFRQLFLVNLARGIITW